MHMQSTSHEKQTENNVAKHVRSAVQSCQLPRTPTHIPNGTHAKWSILKKFFGIRPT